MIPTSNHNLLRKTLPTFLLYIFWSLHQTTTANREDLRLTRCISFDPYIKPQQSAGYIPHVLSCISFDLYIKPQHPHSFFICSLCCISFDPYIKPQRRPGASRHTQVVYLLIPTSNHNELSLADMWRNVVYLLIPTSNHNICPQYNNMCTLYIFWSLHQTTTSKLIRAKMFRCISFDPYIKPQLSHVLWIRTLCCISFDPYIKPQLAIVASIHIGVVYLLIPTSNHNSTLPNMRQKMLYLFWSLHQTTTLESNSKCFKLLYIFWYLHQTTTW